jgi:integrase
MKVSMINRDKIEKWFLGLAKKKKAMGTNLSATTANHCLKTLKLMLREAVERGLIQRNPAQSVSKAKEKSPERKLLTLEEFDLLFYGDALESKWNGDQTLYTLNLLAATTGMRMGEIQGLQLKDYQGDHLTVQHSWDRKYGLKETKTNRPRYAFLLKETKKALNEYLAKNDLKEPDSLIFFGSESHTPIYYKRISKAFSNALDGIGVNAEEAKTRRLTFHSWRHFYNTNMRWKVPDAMLRLLTGHQTESMSDHYTQISTELFENVPPVLEEIFGHKGASKRKKEKASKQGGNKKDEG